jgi:hypothetical protein
VITYVRVSADFTSAPAASSSRTASSFPIRVATTSGVQPLVARAFTSAPALTSAFTAHVVVPNGVDQRPSGGHRPHRTAPETAHAAAHENLAIVDAMGSLLKGEAQSAGENYNAQGSTRIACTRCSTMLPSSSLAGTAFAAAGCRRGAMAERTLNERVEILEQKVEPLATLPDRMTAVEGQILHLRHEMQEEFSAVRAEVRASEKALRAEMHALRTDMQTGQEALRTEMRALNDHTGTQMRVLHEDLVARIKLIQENRPTRRKPRE